MLCLLDADGTNFLKKYLVAVALGGMGKEEHLTEDCPLDEKATKIWKHENKRILAFLVNSIENKSMLIHCEIANKLWELLDFVDGIDLHSRSDH